LALRASAGCALSIVIPAWNEAARIGPTLVTLRDHFASRSDLEILVVDDGSTDGTAGVVKDAGVRLIAGSENRGKGAAVRAGVLATSGQRVLVSDADLAAPIDQLPRLEAALDGGSDIAIGSRDLPDSDIRVRQHPARELMGRSFNLILRALAMTGFRDTQCGFKLFRGDVARDLFARARVDGYAFDVEILLLARGKYRVAEVPVVWRHVEESRVSPGRDAARMLWDVLIMRARMGRSR
jgi:dolichyl-phosphate beta-glucosyltransferase